MAGLKGRMRRGIGLQQGLPLEAGVGGCRQGSGVFDMPCVIGLGYLNSFPFSPMHEKCPWAQNKCQCNSVMEF